MEWTALLADIFQVCVIPLLGVLTAFFVKWVNAKSAEIKTNIKDATLAKYMSMLTKTITDCVIATNQTYVEALKKSLNLTETLETKVFHLDTIRSSQWLKCIKHTLITTI